MTNAIALKSREGHRKSADGIRNEFGPDRRPWKNDVMLMMYAHRLSNADGMCPLSCGFRKSR
jgi:hypothetical protein